MTDESVEHALDTVAVRVPVDVDRNIAPLVTELIEWPGVRTFASCAGHRRSTNEPRAYVLLAAPAATWSALRSVLTEHCDGLWEIVDLGDAAYLYAAPARVVDIAEALHAARDAGVQCPA